VVAAVADLAVEMVSHVARLVSHSEAPVLRKIGAARKRG
jgi:hypothetical protein